MPELTCICWPARVSGLLFGFPTPFTPVLTTAGHLVRLIIGTGSSRCPAVASCTFQYCIGYRTDIFSSKDKHLAVCRDYRWMNYPGRGRDVKHPQDMSVMTYRGHTVLRTLMRAYFSPPHTTGQRYIYTGCFDGSIVVYGACSCCQQRAHALDDCICRCQQHKK